MNEQGIRAYKILNNPKYIWQLSTSKYQAYKDKNNINMQDIKHKWVEKEMSNHKHGRIVSRFEPLALYSRLHRNEEFSLKINPAISLGAATPTTNSLKNSWTCKSLTCTRKNNTGKPESSLRSQPLQLLKYKVEHLVIFSLDHQQTLSQQESYRIDMAMKSSSLCEKTR